MTGILPGEEGAVALIKQFPAPTGQPISSVDSRKDLAGLVVRSAAGVPRAGILPRHTNALVTARASMGVDVAAFEAVLVRNNLPAFAANDGTTVVPIGAAPAANSRYDIVYAKQNESEAPFSDANNDPILGFVSGGAAASPSLAAALALVPAGGLPLAAVLIPADAKTTQSAGVQISQVFPYTALSGGVILARTVSELPSEPMGADVRCIALTTPGVQLGWLGTDLNSGAKTAGWYPVTGGVTAEFFYPSFQLPSGALTLATVTPTLDTAKSSPYAASLFTPVQGGVLTKRSGVYLMTAAASADVVISARYFMDLAASSNDTARTSGVGEGAVLGSVPMRMSVDGQAVLQMFQASGAARTMNPVRLRMTFLGPLL